MDADKDTIVLEISDRDRIWLMYALGTLTAVAGFDPSTRQLTAVGRVLIDLGNKVANAIPKQ